MPWNLGVNHVKPKGNPRSIALKPRVNFVKTQGYFWR
jgi:hypothetical protein